MSSHTLNDKSLRIALLFREATMLDDHHWQAFARQSGLKESKGAWDILNQNVSLGTFRDFLFMDLKTLVPGGKNMGELESAVGAAVKIYPGEIAAILNRNQPDVVRLCHLLVSHEIITTEILATALDKAEQDALNVYDVLVSEGIVSPENVEKAISRRDTDIAQDNRSLLAGDILIFNNLITKDDFSRALESRSVTKAPLSKTLGDLKLISQEELLSALTKGVELPMVELLAFDLAPALLERFPTEFMRRQLFLPLSIQDSHYEIGTADPFNLALADTVSLLTGRRVSMVYTPHNELLGKFEAIFPNQSASSVALTAMPASAAPRASRIAQPSVIKADGNGGGGDLAARVSDADSSRRHVEPFVDNLSTVQLVTQIIEGAVGAKATDIHIEPQADNVRVRFRVDGQLHNIMKVPAEMQLSIVSRIKVLAAMNVTERRRPQDGHFSFSTKGGSYDFRISTLPSFYGEKIVMRVLDSTRVMTGLPQLGLPEEQRGILERLVARPHGLILVTGPTGSGKTSTLYACLSAVNKEDVNIITIEDPAEYQLDGITQVQVDTNIDLTFAAGLRTALRQDPDVIMVGEIRDPDTARTTIRAALTGHLVFSTLHTNTAVGAVSALAHMEIQQYLIASAVSGIIAQRLVRRICENCKAPFTPSKGMLSDLGLATTTRKKFFHGAGCDQCFGTGYRGRTGIFEVIEVNEVLRKAIVERASEQDLAAIAARGGQTLLAAGVSKALEGITTPSEVLKAVSLH